MTSLLNKMPAAFNKVALSTANSGPRCHIMQIRLRSRTQDSAAETLWLSGFFVGAGQRPRTCNLATRARLASLATREPK